MEPVHMEVALLSVAEDHIQIKLQLTVGSVNFATYEEESLERKCMASAGLCPWFLK